MNYPTLLFDVDDTLLNFQASEHQAIQKLFNQINRPLTSKAYQNYHQMNEGLWRRLERGEISRETLLNTRFQIFFSQYGLDVDGVAYEKQYRQFLSAGHDPIPNAVQLLNDLSHHHQLYIVTNGIAATQKRRLRESRMTKYITKMFVSETVGHPKPEPQFFDYVAESIDHFDKQQSLVVGDSLTSDILGAANYGLDSVWFNPAHQQNSTLINPTYEIAGLMELENIV
ncbi:YjjG family noncanonical pyrimidine nucleotidase [Lentilactobacillus diolivorans]|uniref:HAD hydrolase family n=2 Tax=Lentilactobacillus diolivorans TaxID=179838 RepID=A0A0R1S557_9LACO|nr:YjjG family noncanonical pyrimidine nucleotidase [Lentilactobacillus diolivorans]KRL64128.1 HAD hydrolase family [Lentilactobacillus diolivorans DSM 14421]GEP23613.1 noncanonical pyrimidine nucleotidase, YjjG family protein [Lentilactobacillus diolivorans]